MLKNAALIGALLVFAFSILVTSTLRTANPEYVFSPAPAFVLGEEEATGSGEDVAYYLPYHGILPNHPLWPVKAARDRVWLALTVNDAKRANLLLFFADKRIGMVEELFKEGKPEEGVPAAYKAEQYLEAAYSVQEEIAKDGTDTTDLLTRLALAALKHEEMLEGARVRAPEDARPHLTEALNYTKSVYEKAKAKLGEKNRPIPTPETP